MERQETVSHKGTPEKDATTWREYGGKAGQASDLDGQHERADFPGTKRPRGQDIDSSQLRDDEGLFTPIREPG